MSTDLLYLLPFATGSSLLVFLAHLLRSRVTSAPVFALAGLLTLLFWQLLQVGWWVTWGGIQAQAGNVAILPALLLGMTMVYALDGLFAARTYLLVVLITGVISWGFAEFIASLSKQVPIPHGFILASHLHLATLVGLLGGAVIAAGTVAAFRRHPPAITMGLGLLAGTLGELATTSLIAFGPVVGFHNFSNQLVGTLLFALPSIVLAVWRGHIAGRQGEHLPVRKLGELLRFWHRSESNLQEAREDILAANRIISDLRMLNQQLDEAKRIHDHQVFHSPLAILHVTTGGAITFANPAAERLFGAAGGSLPGHRLDQWLGDNQRLTSPELERLSRLRDSKVCEIRPTAGRTLWVDLLVLELHDPQGRPTGFHLLLKDVTRKVEQQFRASVEEKVQGIHRTSRLIIHDFSNLLIGLRGVVDNACQALDTEDAVNLRQVMATVRSGIDRGSALLSQLGEFPLAKPHPRPVSLSRLLSEAVELIRPPLTRKEISLEFPPFAPCHVNVDTIQIERVFSNLLINAVRAMSVGGRLQLLVVPEEAAVAIRIIDDGVGMTDDQLAQAFSPGFSTKGQGQGGLGLSIAYLIVDAHGGTLSLSRHGGEGIEARVWLPTTAPGLDHLDRWRGKGVIVALISDALAERLAVALDQAGLLVADVRSREELVDLLAEDPDSWQLLLTDQADYDLLITRDQAIVRLDIEGRRLVLVQPGGRELAGQELVASLEEGIQGWW